MWQMGGFKTWQGVSQASDTQKEVSGCYWIVGLLEKQMASSCSVFFLLTFSSRFTETVSHVLKEILSLCTFNPNWPSPVNPFSYADWLTA